ncbi:MAG: rRNA maturation RNase YbeY [candidate division Zixibacteria bacterium]|nr:rRNA maturation RNase YbeY [candidate division Zixibacteria bacterium]
MKLNIFKETKIRIPWRKLETLFTAVTQNESTRADKGQVNLIMTTNSRLRALNHQFRDIDNATDVLSFNLDEPDDINSIFGEIYIAVPIATHQAKQYRATLSQELLRLTCHGLLHLYGYDHQTDSQRQEMLRLEEQYLLATEGKNNA